MGRGFGAYQFRSTLLEKSAEPLSAVEVTHGSYMTWGFIRVEVRSADWKDDVWG